MRRDGLCPTSQRSQFIKMKNTTSSTVLSCTGVPQGTVLAPFLFTLCTSDFQCHSGLCHLQKDSDNTVGQEEGTAAWPRTWWGRCGANHLQLNISKTKETVVDL